ncbi:MAG: hypothetical protein MJ158_04100 [Alphaproteobacteria bacterium]|nr:hypothetical protein [Alphaproteobacteria bacterium]
MKFIKNLMKVLSKNMGYTILLCVAVLLFVIFSGGLLPGIITAITVLIAYICIEHLYIAYKAITEKKRKK